jgi:hypothetical protein
MNRTNPTLAPEIEALTAATLGAAFEVSNTLGHGFLEAVYREEVVHSVSYKNLPVGSYRADLVVSKSVIVEMKAIERLLPQHVGQILNYLRASGMHVGLLINFGKPRVEYKRVLL